MEIRRATKADIDALVELFNKYRIFYKQEPDVLAAKAFIEERLDKNESVIFLAMQDNEPVAFTQLYPIFSSVSMKRTWLLNDLYVDVKVRKKGVAQLLLQAAANHGVSVGAKWMLLQTGSDNSSAQSLYEKTGWRRVDDYFYQLDL